MLAYGKKLLALLGPRKNRVILVLSFFVLLSVFDIFGIGLIGSFCAVLLKPELAESSPIFQEFFIGEGFGNHKRVTLFLSFALVTVFCIKAVIALLIQRYIFRYCFSVQVMIQRDLLMKYQQMEYLEYAQETSADYITKLQVYVRTFSIGILLPLLKTFGDLIVGASILVFLAFLSWEDFLVLFGFFGTATFVYTKVFRKKLYGLGKGANEGWAITVKAIQESLRGLREIRLLKKEKFFLNQLVMGAEDFAYNNARYGLIVSAPRYLFETMMVLVFVYLLLKTFSTDGDIEMVIPLIAMYAAAGVRLLPIANGVTTSFSQLTFGRHAVESLYRDYSRPGPRFELENKRSTEEFFPKGDQFRELELLNVCFTYPKSSIPVLNGVDISIKRGEIVGIKGESGAGKSTLVNILLGLIWPDNGRVMFNSQPLCDNLDAWWRHLAYVPQELFFVDGSLRENVALGEKDADIDENLLWSVISRANLYDFVSSHPEGLDKNVGEDGINLSGGQRQRVAIARALYFHRDVLVLDEATSALDTETERAIIDDLLKLAGEITIIIVAHRESTLQACGTVYRIEGGRAFAEKN